MGKMNKKAKPVRNPNETILSCSIPKKIKQSVFGRAELLERSASQLVKWALEEQEKTGWSSIRDASLDPDRQRQLERWLKEGDFPLS
tara:strand:+ start:380 stop:640 length:261 start_codon:yes stop_codon:yes gene_type:complete